MKKGNIVASLLCIALGAYVLIQCLGYPTAEAYGTGAPGPGLWPGVIAAGLILAALWVLITALRTPAEEQGQIAIWGDAQKRVYVTMIILLVYCYLTTIVGFIPTTIVMMFIFVHWFAKYKWYMTLLISVAVSVVVYVIFKYALNVPIDFGMIAF